MVGRPRKEPMHVKMGKDGQFCIVSFSSLLPRYLHGGMPLFVAFLPPEHLHPFRVKAYCCGVRNARHSPGSTRLIMTPARPCLDDDDDDTRWSIDGLWDGPQ